MKLIAIIAAFFTNPQVVTLLRVAACFVCFAVWMMAGFIIQVQHRPIGFAYAAFAVLGIAGAFWF